MRSAAVVLLTLVAQASAQTAFTYQGRLDSLGDAAGGVYDMRFSLYDGVSSPTQIGPTQCVDNIVVTDGIFTATIDFGAQFNGAAARFLEIAVREDIGLTCASPDLFTVLAPRQQITSTPRATAAKFATALVRPNGTGAGVVNVTDTGLVGVGTAAPVASLHVAGGDIVAGPLGKEWIFHTRPSFNGEFLHITDADNGIFQFQRGLIVHENGSVGIGAVPNGSSRLFVNGQIGLTPTFRVKSLHGASFLPDTVGRETGGFGRYSSAGVSGYFGDFIAPVELPDGCQVQRIDLTFVDNRTTDFTLTFGRTSATTGIASSITSVSTNGQSSAVRVVGVDLAGFGIGNNSNAYWLKADLDSFGGDVHQIVAVRITYTVTSPLP